MILKRIGAVVIAALAVTAVLAGPAWAAGQPLVSGGSPVATGTGIAGTAVGNVNFNSSAGSVLFVCTGASLSGPVSQNSGGTSSITLESAQLTGPEAEGKCKTSLGNATVTVETPSCLRHNTGMETGEWQLSNNACGAEGGIPHLVIATNTAGTCKYRTSGSSWHFGGSLKTSPLQIATNEKFTKESGSILCYSTLYLNATFQLKTAGGAELMVVE